MNFMRSPPKPEIFLAICEEELAGHMRAANEGDQAAYRSLMETVAVAVCAAAGFALARTGCGTPEAEDIVQETLLAIHAKRHTWDPRRPATPWLLAIARKKLLDRLSKVAAPTPARSDPKAPPDKPNEATSRASGVNIARSRWRAARAAARPPSPFLAATGFKIERRDVGSRGDSQ